MSENKIYIPKKCCFFHMIHSSRYKTKGLLLMFVLMTQMKTYVAINAEKIDMNLIKC